MITGLNHLTIAVKALEKSFQFYRDILGFKPLLKHSKGAYFLAGDLWFCLDLDASTRKGPLPEYTHIAFSVDPAAFAKLTKIIHDSKIQIWKENVSEGPSLYFLDPDGHKLEIHIGNWQTRLQAAKAHPWDPSMEFF